MTFGIGPHRPGRILPGGVEVKRRDWCGVGTDVSAQVGWSEHLL